MRDLWLCVLLALPTANAQLRVKNAQLETRPANGSLRAELARLQTAPAPLWVAYTVPTIAPFQSGWGGGTAYLERDNSETGSPAATGQNRAVILLRLANGSIAQLRAESPERTLNAGGLRFVTLANISPQDSIATLQQLAATSRQQSLREAAVFLIGQHASPAAVPALLALAAPASPGSVREQAAFWLANARGHEGFLALQNFARNDPDSGFREKLAFDLTLSPDREALPELIRMAHDDRSPHVRQQAQFWMAKRAEKGDEALIVTNLRAFANGDPDPEVRRQAVFAVSQLPGTAAVTELTRLAGSAKDAEVRKQAIFWLGQSNDPRALAYLTGVLGTTSAR